MKKITIRTPFWKEMGVGVDKKMALKEDIHIEISYLNKSGNLEFPHLYLLTPEMSKTCKEMYLKKPTPMIICPIAKLGILERRDGRGNPIE